MKFTIVTQILAHNTTSKFQVHNDNKINVVITNLQYLKDVQNKRRSTIVQLRENRENNQPTTPQTAMIVTPVSQSFPLSHWTAQPQQEMWKDDSTHQGINIYCFSEIDRCHHYSVIRRSIVQSL